MKNLKLLDVMTPLPKSVRPDLSVSDAHKIMLKERCRHLPVLHKGKVVGLVSDRDLHLVSQNLAKDDLEVSEAMSEAPYVAGKNAPLLEAINQMLEKKYGSVLVEDNAKNIVGIFTVHDALRLLAEELELVAEDARENEEFHRNLARNSRPE